MIELINEYVFWVCCAGFGAIMWFIWFLTSDTDLTGDPTIDYLIAQNKCPHCGEDIEDDDNPFQP